MTLGSSKRWYAALLIAFFLCMQGFSSAHAASFVDDPHDHDGVMCVVGVSQASGHAILPTPPVVFEPAPLQLIRYTAEFTSVRYLPAAARAPPGRSPPTPIQ